MQEDRTAPKGRGGFSARPLLDTRPDRARFTGRAAELRRIGAALADGLNCAVVGDPGSGRTSLLHRALAAVDQPVVLIGGGAVTDVADLLDRIVAGLGPTGLTAPAPAPAVALPTGADPVLDRIALLRERTADARPLIAIDDVPPPAGTDLFGRYRDELWTVPANWLVTVSSAHAASLLRPPVDVFFEVRIDLAPLDAATAESLLRKRIGTDTDESKVIDVDRVIAAAQGNPRRLIELARRYAEADPDSAGSAIDAVRSRDTRLARMSTPARMLAAELDALGAASASDPALLDRLGWTRSRAVQVLKELEQAGLVVASDERTGPGRPRRIYRLTTDA
jgi:hypothetical protein